MEIQNEGKHIFDWQQQLLLIAVVKELVGY